MKKYTAVIAVIALITAFAAGTQFGKSSEKKNDNSSKPAVTTSAEKNSDAAAEGTTSEGEEATQSDPLAPAEAQATESPAEQVTDAPEEKTGQPDPEGDGSFSYDDSGAVVFDGGSSDGENDSTLIAAGQALFESACRTQWEYTVGTPYDYDRNIYIEDDLGWQYYLVTTDGIDSLADVENEYYQVFSSNYPNELSGLYKESGGALYTLCGERGMDIFYSYSKVTSITSRTDNEIFFTVENYYTGTDRDSTAAYSETDEFSAVIGSDGTWRAGKFRLPY